MCANRTAQCLATRQQKTKDLKVLDTLFFMNCFTVWFMFHFKEVHAYIFNVFFVCRSPEGEPGHPQFGNAAKTWKAQTEAGHPSTICPTGHREYQAGASRSINIQCYPKLLLSLKLNETKHTRIQVQEAGGSNQMPGGMDHDRSAQMLVPSVDIRIRALNQEPNLNGYVFSNTILQVSEKYSIYSRIVHK